MKLDKNQKANLKHKGYYYEKGDFCVGGDGEFIKGITAWRRVYPNEEE